MTDLPQSSLFCLPGKAYSSYLFRPFANEKSNLTGGSSIQAHLAGGFQEVLTLGVSGQARSKWRSPYRLGRRWRRADSNSEITDTSGILVAWVGIGTVPCTYFTLARILEGCVVLLSLEKDQKHLSREEGMLA